MKLDFLLPQALLFAAAAATPLQDVDVSTTLQNILANTNNNPGYTYPTDLTRGIVPVQWQQKSR